MLSRPFKSRLTRASLKLRRRASSFWLIPSESTSAPIVSTTSSYRSSRSNSFRGSASRACPGRLPPLFDVALGEVDLPPPECRGALADAADDEDVVTGSDVEEADLRTAPTRV